MGIFSNFFSSEKMSSEESRAINDITKVYSMRGFDKVKARENAKNTYAACKEKCELGGLLKYSGIGNKVFEMGKDDNNLERCIRIAKLDNLSDEAIISWWEASCIDREVVERLDEENRLAAYVSYLDKGLSSEEAANKVKKYYPIYGYSDEIDNLNRPLPPEIRSYLNQYLDTLQSSGQMFIDYIKTEIEKEETYNAFVRQLIKRGFLSF